MLVPDVSERVAATESNVRERHEWPIRQAFGWRAENSTAHKQYSVWCSGASDSDRVERGSRVFVGIT